MIRQEKLMYYRCKGAWRTSKVCDTPHFRVPDVDNAVWEWLKSTLLYPENIAIGLQNVQEETIRSNQSLYERLDIIQNRIDGTIRQQEKLLDLYLSDNFPKEMLQEKKSRLEETLANLRKEQADISSHLQTTVLSDEQIEEIKAFCDAIRDRLENATFEQKRQLIDMLDVRGTLAIENEEKVIYVKCHLGQQLVSVARTLPWQCNHKGHPIIIRIRLVLPPPALFTRIENFSSQDYSLGESFSYAEPVKITA